MHRAAPPPALPPPPSLRSGEGTWLQHIASPLCRTTEVRDQMGTTSHLSGHTEPAATVGILPVPSIAWCARL